MTDKAPERLWSGPIQEGTCNAWSEALVRIASVPSTTALWRTPVLDPSIYAMAIIAPALMIDGRVTLEVGPHAATQEHIKIPATSSETRRATVADLMRELEQWTDWSQRKIATVIGTTHPTVRRLRENETSPRSSEAIGRLRRVHAVVSRLAPVAADAANLREALTSSSAAGDSPEEMLRNDNFIGAYQLALSALVGDTPDMLGGVRLQTRDATYPADTNDWA